MFVTSHFKPVYINNLYVSSIFNYSINFKNNKSKNIENVLIDTLY